MERFVEQTLLYDFYGELLTERQQQVYESVVLEDYSLSEVAEDLGISRQGVHDMIKRCNHTLEEYEGEASSGREISEYQRAGSSDQRNCSRLIRHRRSQKFPMKF